MTHSWSLTGKMSLTTQHTRTDNQTLVGVQEQGMVDPPLDFPSSRLSRDEIRYSNPLCTLYHY
jgi:hypothetical protein